MDNDWLRELLREIRDRLTVMEARMTALERSVAQQKARYGLWGALATALCALGVAVWGLLNRN